MMSVTMLLVICTSRNSASMPWAIVTSRSPAAHTSAGAASPPPASAATMAMIAATNRKVLSMESSFTGWSALSARITARPKTQADSMSAAKGCQGWPSAVEYCAHSHATVEHVEGPRLAAQPVVVPALVVGLQALQHLGPPALLVADGPGGSPDLLVESGDVQREKPSVLHDQPPADDGGGNVLSHGSVQERLHDVELIGKPRIVQHAVEVHEDGVGLHARHQRAEAAGEPESARPVHRAHGEHLARVERRRIQIVARHAVELVEHAQLHHRVLVIIDRLVVQAHGHVHAAPDHLVHRGEAVAHAEVAARMTGDGGASRGENVDVLVGHPDGVAKHHMLVDQAALVQPRHRGSAVFAQGEGLLDGRLQTVHVDGDLAEAIGRLLGAGEEGLRDRLGPARAEEDARVLGV